MTKRKKPAVQPLNWTKDFHDSQVWLTADLTTDLSVVMSSWGPAYSSGGRHAELKSWECLLCSGNTCVLWFGTQVRCGMDITDEHAKRLCVETIAEWFADNATTLKSIVGGMARQTELEAHGNAAGKELREVLEVLNGKP